LSLHLAIHVVFKVAAHVCLRHLLDLALAHAVLGVPLNAVLVRVGVVEHGLIQVVSEIHGHRIPASILVVNDEQIPVVLEAHQNVIFLGVVVSKDDGKDGLVILLLRNGNELSKEVLVAVEEERALNFVDNIQVLLELLHLLFLSSLAHFLDLCFDRVSETREAGFELRTPFIYDLVDKEVLFVEGV